VSGELVPEIVGQVFVEEELHAGVWEGEA
jgi:hypothetical protein